MKIYPYYLHYKKSSSVDSIAVGIGSFVTNMASGKVVSAIYSLCNGLKKETVATYSGLEMDITYNFFK